MNTFKKTTLALAVFTLASGAIAQTAPAPAPAPTASPITANITITNDYRYRGISQSNFLPGFKADLITPMRAVFILVTGTHQLVGLVTKIQVHLLQLKWIFMEVIKKNLLDLVS